MTPDQQIQAIRDALTAGPTPGPWNQGGSAIWSDVTGYPVVTVCGYDSSRTRETAAYVAACNPTAITALLARLDAAEADAARYQHWRWSWSHEYLDMDGLPCDVTSFLDADTAPELSESFDKAIAARAQEGGT